MQRAGEGRTAADTLVIDADQSFFAGDLGARRRRAHDALPVHTVLADVTGIIGAVPRGRCLGALADRTAVGVFGKAIPTVAIALERSAARHAFVVHANEPLLTRDLGAGERPGLTALFDADLVVFAGGLGAWAPVCAITDVAAIFVPRELEAVDVTLEGGAPADAGAIDADEALFAGHFWTSRRLGAALGTAGLA